MNNLYIKSLKSEKTESTIQYGQFSITSLQPGQGITIGNLLRRILLSDLGGTSITAVRIIGVKNEYASIPGLREDTLEILLNLKGIILKNKTKNAQSGYLKVQGPCIITADLIQLPSNLEIINPNHYIATISTTDLLEIEFKFEYGIGYKLIEQTFDNKLEDFLKIDAVFMPVRKVDFKIENIYDNSKAVTERLIIDVWTNGSLTPKEAIHQALEFIVDFFNSLIKNQSNEEINKLEKNKSTTTLNRYTKMSIEELQLSARPYNCLKRAQINTIGDLLAYSPEKLRELKNFGRKSADEVFIVLKRKLGIVLK